MPERRAKLPAWFSYLDLSCTAIACALWYALPQAGPWPLLLALAPWLARYILAGRLSRRCPFDLPLLLFVFTAGLAVWAAYDRALAWPKFWLIAGGVLLFYAFANAADLGDIRLWLLAAFGAGVAVYFLASHGWDEFPAKIDTLTRLGQALQAPIPSLPVHRLHPNVAGGIMAMMLPFAGWATIDAGQRLRTASRSVPATRWSVLALGGLCLALTAFGLLMTTSRGAWLAAGCALLVALIWALAGWLSRGAAKRRAWFFAGMLAALLAAAALTAFAWPGGLTALAEALPGPKTGAGRLDLLAKTLLLVRDYPFIGAGLGGFRMLYSTYVLLLHVGFTVHSHNLFLDLAVEQGLVAVFALLWMWALFGWALVRSIIRSGRGPGLGALGVAALSLLVVLVHGLVDDVLFGSRGVVLLFLPLAFALPALDAVPTNRRRASLLLPLAIVALMVLALIWRDPLISTALSNLGAVRQSQAELGTYSWPEWDIQDQVRRAVDISQPLASYQRALALDPANATANRRLGQIELSLGQYEPALQHLAAAYQAEPWSDTTRQLYGEALIANGRLDEGRALWQDLDATQQQLQIRAYWYQSIGDEQRALWMKSSAPEP